MSAGIIDTNVTLGLWPLRRLPADTPAALLETLAANGIAQAWCGSFEALLHKDIAGVNARLASRCAKHADLLLPMGAVNPLLPDWEDDLWRCAKEHRMPGIRLHPNYHGYRLDQPAFAELLARATGLKLLVQIPVQLEDERMMHPLLRVPPVDLAPLPDILTETPGARVVVLNALKGVATDLLKQCAGAGEVCFDIGMLEGVGGIRNMLEHLPLDRLVFGSHAPLFYPESAVLKLQESALDEAERAAIERENAERLAAP